VPRRPRGRRGGFRSDLQVALAGLLFHQLESLLVCRGPVTERLDLALTQRADLSPRDVKVSADLRDLPELRGSRFHQLETTDGHAENVPPVPESLKSNPVERPALARAIRLVVEHQVGRVRRQGACE
jgi:hypothetical protein